MPALKFDDIKLIVHLDEYSWGDLEDIEGRSQSKILDVCSRLVTVDGVEPTETRATLRKIHYKDIDKVVDTVVSALLAEGNPVDGTGKN
jgi:hypothetical protein